jgi:carboxylesterase type B
MGSTSMPVYSGEQLAKMGAVVVSIAYRVGPLGFLAHPELSAESESHVSGNYGLLDQIAALRWVQRNIKAFGGDASRVTIFGESAGGISVSMLAASPLMDSAGIIMSRKMPYQTKRYERIIEIFIFFDVQILDCRAHYAFMSLVINFGTFSLFEGSLAGKYRTD